MNGLDFKTRARIFGRLLLLQSTWSFERMQGLGFAWALEPWLEKIYPRAADRRAALERHTEYFNTQPYVASLVVGLVCALEEKAATLPEEERPAAFERLRAVKKTISCSLAGLGDSFFWRALRPASAAAATAVGAFFLARASRWAGPAMAATYLASYNIPALWLRWRGLAWGYMWREQMPVKLKQAGVQSWVRRVRWAGLFFSLLLIGILAGAVPPGVGRVLAAAALGLSWLAYELLPARVNAARLYGVGCGAALAVAAAGWL